MCAGRRRGSGEGALDGGRAGMRTRDVVEDADGSEEVVEEEVEEAVEVGDTGAVVVSDMGALESAVAAPCAAPALVSVAPHGG